MFLAEHMQGAHFPS